MGLVSRCRLEKVGRPRLTAVAELERLERGDGPLLHINREMLHHRAETALLRDLYLWHYDG
jgi:hypothetical protein